MDKLKMMEAMDLLFNNIDLLDESRLVIILERALTELEMKNHNLQRIIMKQWISRIYRLSRLHLKEKERNESI